MNGPELEAGPLDDRLAARPAAAVAPIAVDRCDFGCKVERGKSAEMLRARARIQASLAGSVSDSVVARQGFGHRL